MKLNGLKILNPGHIIYGIETDKNGKDSPDDYFVKKKNGNNLLRLK